MKLLYTELAFLFFILLEIFISNFRKSSKVYSLRDTINNFSLNFLAIGFEMLIRGLGISIMYFFYKYRAFDINMGNPLMWFFLFIGQDLSYYCRHYCEHHFRILWAVHSVHHSSQQFNYSVALRRSIFQGFYRPIFFIPLVLIGFDPIKISFVYSLSQIYTFFLHSHFLPSFGKKIETVFNTPSLHRVHHANNHRYLNKNLGQTLIIWDILFKTYSREETKPTFGLYNQLQNQNLFSIIFNVWQEIIKDVSLSKNKFKAIFKSY